MTRHKAQRSHQPAVMRITWGLGDKAHVADHIVHTQFECEVSAVD